MLFFSKFSLTEFDCPGDGLCSNQGLCDDITGYCVCNEGFEGTTCKGKINPTNSISTLAEFFFLSDKSCPGGQIPCNGLGQCDLTTGLCNCNIGHQGSDCSGKN